MAERKADSEFPDFQIYIQNLSDALYGINQSVTMLAKESFKFSPSGSKSASDNISSAMVLLDDQTRDSAMSYAKRLQEMLEALQSADRPPVLIKEVKRSLRLATYKAKLSRTMAQTLRNREDSKDLISSLKEILSIIEGMTELPKSDAIDASKVSQGSSESNYVKKIADYIKAEVKEALKCDDLTVNVEEFKKHTNEIQRNVNLANKALTNNIEQLNLIITHLEYLGKCEDEQIILKALSDAKGPLGGLKDVCNIMYTRLKL